ncbi:DUF4247 domain-containing protein [Dactylosporangium sp. NPDC000521]|uniref:DUF4247 domain-containing protein n=1 Tax=Dactylosporangium sp. NPDC000521 TaxID=3363975 RepID=UPI00369822DB
MRHWRRWSWVVVAVLLAAGFAVGGRAVSAGDGSPRGYIARHYTPAPGAEPGPRAVAYVTRLAPSTVTSDLTGAWRPAARHVDPTGVYLRYSADLVVIRPDAGGGALIVVEATSTAYPRYQAQLDGAW